MALDLNRIKQRQAETSRKNSGAFFKPKEGKNIIRIFKFPHEVTKEDVRMGYFSKDKLGEEVEELDRPVVRHFNVTAKGNPVISNERIMEMYNEMKRKNKEKAKEIAPQTAYFLNVLDINDAKNGVVLYAAPSSVYNKILSIVTDPDYGESILGETGRDVVIMYDKNKQGSDKYQVLPRKEGLSEDLPESVLKGVLDLYSEEAFSQMGDQEDGGSAPAKKEEADEDEKETKEEADEEEPKPKATKPGNVNKAVDPDLEDEVEEIFGNKNKKKVEDEDDEEVVLTPPKKKK